MLIDAHIPKEARSLPNLVENHIDNKADRAPCGAGWLSHAGLTRLLLCLVACQLVLQLNSSFWLDETLSYWSTNAGFRQMVSRCTVWPSSILYAALFSALRPFGTLGPWIYRLPSFLAIALCVLMLFRMVKRLFGLEAAWVAVAVFVSLHPVQFAACDARPYAFGLLMILLSTDLLLRYLDRPSFRRAALYAITTALVPYFHLLFGASLVFQVLYVAYCRFTAFRTIRLRHAAFVLAAIFVLVLPLGNQLLASSRSAQTHSFTDRPRPNDFVEMYFTVDLALALLLAFGMAVLAARKLRWGWEQNATGYRVLAVLWAFTAPVLLYAVSSLSEAHVFLPRYFLPYAGGLAICLAVVLGSFSRNVVGIAFIFGLIVMAALPLRHPASLRHAANLGDWGAAIAFLNRQTALNNAPVLMRSQFVESNFLSLTAVEDNPTFAQLSYYPIKARVIPLAATFSEPSRQVIDEAVRTSLESSGRFLFASYSGPPGSPQPFLFYLRGKLGSSWQVREVGNFDDVVVTEFALRP
jgi:hypothetical protein